MGPTGIPDPNNPGFDTGGYPLTGAAANPSAFVNTSPTASSQPTGIPDPNYPGYDTAGFRLGSKTGANGATTIPNTATGMTWVTNPTPTGTAGNTFATGVATPTSPTGDGLVNAYTGTMPDYASAPIFTPPTYTPPPAFVAPTIADALNDPGYSFGMQQGEQALQNSAAAGGVLNSGNTLKNILAFGNNYATTKYDDLYNRDLNTYNTNYQTQYVDPYKASYQAALDIFQPKLADWAARNNFNWQEYLQGYNQYRNRINDTVNVNSATS